MEGMGNVVFPASTSNAQAQRFINQGVAQLHGFWYYEAERSFRQAATLDPDCAISYWGMALANVNNRKRAQGFIKQAVKRRDNASPREQMFIDAWSQALTDPEKPKSADDGKKDEQKDEKKEDKKDEKAKPEDEQKLKRERAQRLTRDLEKIVLDYPDDIEAKALLALQLWENERNDLPIVSHVAINAILDDVFDKNPMHPAHHYRIHLWDRQDAARALKSAALCGPSLPGIAHMWHMPGHIYSKLHRYQDAVWQQEASARVDHAHMMRDRLLPDQIHNFAHNNEWLIRNLIKLGQSDKAVALAKNMIELPRHPKLNTLKKGSSQYGRQRLLQSLSSFRMWPELIALSDTAYLEPTDDETLQVERLRHLGIAHASLGHANETDAVKRQLNERLDALQRELEQLEEPKKPEERCHHQHQPPRQLPQLRSL